MINCTFENGNRASLRHVVADIIVTNEKNQILLIKRAAHLSNGGKWGVVGGFVERDETVEEAAKRELKEETGLVAKSIKFIKFIDNPNRKNEDRQNVAFVYHVKPTGKVKIQESEVEDYKWFDLDKLPDEIDFAFDHFEIVKEYLKNH